MPSTTSFFQGPGGDLFGSAVRRGFRGWFYFPTLDPAEMTPRMTRQDLAYKAWWLYENVDVVSAVIDGLAADEVDTGVWPKATTKNRMFNREVNELFEAECGRPDTFHSAEEESFYSAQVLIRRHIRLVGEHFGQLLEPSAFSPHPALHLCNPWQVGNAATTLDQSKWKDGIMSNRLGKALQFRFTTNAERTSWIDVPRENVLHFHDQFWTGQQRGLSGLAPITRKLFRYDQIEAAEGSGMLLRTRLAYAITKKDADGDGPSIIPGATETTTQEQSDGTKLVVQKIAAGDTEVDVADLPMGYDFKVVESNRAQMTPEWLRWMLFGIGHASKYPPEYIFFLSGITNGTLVRMLQKRVQRIKNNIRWFQLVKQFVPYWYEFWLWQRMKTGRFDSVPGGIPEDFLRHKIIMPADDTVDVGREGRLWDERLEKGHMSPDAYYGMQGEAGSDVDDERLAMIEERESKLDEMNERRAKLNKPPLTYAQVWPMGNAAPPAAVPPPDPEEDPEDPEEDPEEDAPPTPPTSRRR